MLGQARALSRPNHKLGKGALALRMDRFVEFARAGSHRRGRVIRSSEYPKKGYILTLLLYCCHSGGLPGHGKRIAVTVNSEGRLWKISKVWRRRWRQSVLWALRRPGPQFVGQMLSPGMFQARFRQGGVADRIRRLNRSR